MKNQHLWLLYTLVLLIGGQATAAAQGGTTCPANVLLAQSRASSACASMERGEACYGSGSVTVEAYDDTTLNFTQAGDRIPAQFINTITTDSSAEALIWSVAQIRLSADLAESAGRTLTILLIGDSVLENNVPPVQQVNATAIGAVNIRTQPRADADIVDRAPVRADLIASGRSGDSLWVRVRQPNSNIVGWASVDVLSLQSSVTRLDSVEGDPLLLPFQVMTVSTPDLTAPCEGAPESGVIIQAPNTGDATAFTLSGWDVRLLGTAFIQEDAAVGVTVNMIDGEAEIGGAGGIWFIPAGARIVLSYSADGSTTVEPFDPLDMTALPINSLPERLRRVPDPLTPDEIERLTREHFAVPATPTPSPTPDANRCVRVLARNETLRAGPGFNYEAINELRAGTELDPVLSARDNTGAAWWQLRGSNWVQRSAVRETGICQEVPVTTSIQAPSTNTLPLETCESTNGPLRAGQRVTITFVPPAFENILDARSATNIDPGTVTVNDQRLQVRAGEPQPVGDGRYVRVFSATWTATSGNHRIIGDRLSYEPSCTLTVPLN